MLDSEDPAKIEGQNLQMAKVGHQEHRLPNDREPRQRFGVF